MLKNFMFNGFMINKHNYQDFGVATNNPSRYNVEVNAFSYENKADRLYLTVTSDLSVYSLSENNSETLRFRSELNLTLEFIVSLESEFLNSEFERDNEWFFSSFLAIALKLAYEGILKNTALQSITLPWSLINKKV